MGDYLFSTEIVTALFCFLILLFIKFNKPKRTITFRLCLRGLILLFTEMMIEIFLYSYSIAVETPSYILIDILLSLQTVVHVLMLIALLLYIDSLSVTHHVKRKHALVPIVAMMVVYTIYFLFVLSPQGVYQYENGSLNITAYIIYIDFASIIANILTMIYLHFRAKEFPRGITHLMIYSMPTMLLVQVLQLLYYNKLFHGIIYLLPLMSLYFFYHNNPYDQFTGYQDVSSFESMFEIYLYKKKKFHYIYIELPKLKNSDYMLNVIQDSKEAQKQLIKTCRQLEYSCKKAKLYRLTSYSFGILMPSINAKKDAINLETIKTVILNSSQEVGDEIYFYAAHFEYDSKKNGNYNSSLGMQYVNYVIANNALDPVDTWIDTRDEDFDSFLEEYKVEQELLDICNHKNLNDPRVICYVQPIFNVKTKTYRSAEALMRLQLDDKMIFPDKFIPLAEKHECIHDLTCIILNKVCQYIKSVENDLDFDCITINCSSIELSKNNIYDDVKTILEANHVNPSKIRIELTESAMFESYDNVKTNLNLLKNLGISFYLDDFGTGYSNFERIMTCPLQTIKFDKGLLYRAISTPAIDKMIATLIPLFKENGFQVLVEGVEDSGQKDFAIERGFEYIQGYYFSKPVPIETLNEYFSGLN